MTDGIDAEYNVAVETFEYIGDRMLNREDKIIGDVFKQFGLNLNNAERAGGWTNSVWFNGNTVLRLSSKQGNDRIRRETELAKRLPPPVGYPVIIATGITDGYEWSLCERIKGNPLSGVWSDLSFAEKATAAKQTVEIMNAVHSVDFSDAEHLVSRAAWYSSFNRDETLTDINRYVTQNIFTAEQGSDLRDLLERFYNLHNSAALVLNHGDITRDNLLWNDGKIVSLLDFEHSVIAPPQLDIRSIVVEFLGDNEKDSGYIKSIKGVLEPFLTCEKERELLAGYMILFYQRFLEFWLEKPEGELDECEAYQKLLSLTRFRGAGFGWFH